MIGCNFRKTNYNTKIYGIDQRGEVRLRRAAIFSALMFGWILIWALVFKLGSEILMLRNYHNLKDMTIGERLIWDLIPFNYRGDEYWIMRQKIDTVLNCFVFSPFGVFFSYAFKKGRIIYGLPLCFAICATVEISQLFTLLGNFATEDFITNIVGYFIGLIIYLIIFKRLSVTQSTAFFRVINVLLAILTIFSVGTIIYTRDVIVGIITRAF